MTRRRNVTAVYFSPTGGTRAYVEAIAPETPRATDPVRRLRCLACVRVCPTGSRGVRQPAFGATVARLEGNFAQPRQPKLYL